MHPNTPILVGSGQITRQSIDAAAEIPSPADLAGEAVNLALADTGVLDLAARVDTLALVRLFADSVPGLSLHPFGSSDNLPRSVAQRAGADPARLIYGPVGGHSPQRLINEFAEAIARGESDLAVVSGAEAIGAAKLAGRQGWQPDWREEVGGSFEDRGCAALQTQFEAQHHITLPTQVYALFENAWRHRHGLSVEAHRELMADVLLRLNQVARSNPLAQFPTPREHAFLARASAENFPIAEPYNKWSVAQDAVNQGAAVVLTSVAQAERLGIPRDKWVFLHGYADADDTWVSERPDLSTSAALKSTADAALTMARQGTDAIQLFDLYSCFPVAVLAACEALGIAPDDPRPLTVTGGLPFFGGPGNNYSLHGVAEMLQQLRRRPGAFGLVTANGGYLSKQSVGIYSTRAVDDWQPADKRAERSMQAQTPVTVDPTFSGQGSIETCSVVFRRGTPDHALMIGRSVDNTRFLAKTAEGDTDTPRKLLEGEPLGRRVSVTRAQEQCLFTLAE
jgi:acetyl-CoA C-acetyltransferase